jgi:hypothetical protein
MKCKNYLGDGSVVSCDVILNLVDLVVLRVDGSDEHVVRDILQVTTELQPGAGCGNVVGCALSLDLRTKSKFIYYNTRINYKLVIQVYRIVLVSTYLIIAGFKSPTWIERGL